MPKRPAALWPCLLALMLHPADPWAAGTFSVVGPERGGGGAAAKAGQESCTVLNVYDGDTVKADCGGVETRIRFHCIDAPELGQGRWGKDARDHLRGLLAGRRIAVRPEKTDRYGRTVGDVEVGGESVELAMVRGGQAAVYAKYCQDPAYFSAEAEAKAARRGIWSRPGEQQTPWAYRHSRD